MAGPIKVSRLRPNYGAVLQALPEAYRVARFYDAAELAEAFCRLADSQVDFVGSGGALAVAKLAADAFGATTGVLARALTPGQLIDNTATSASSVVIFSARATNPDTRMAAHYATAFGAKSVYVVTNRSDGRRPIGIPPSAKVIHLPAPPIRDGFLATQTVITTAVIILRALGLDVPESLPAFKGLASWPVRARTLIAYGSGDGCVAIDLEARLAETGISSPQLADFRNLAHGRHVGLARNLAETTVVAIIGEKSRALARATLEQLPSSTDILRLEASGAWPVEVLDLLVQSMSLISTSAELIKLDPANPRVSSFGRRLYHLDPAPFADQPVRRPIALKFRAAGLRPSPSAIAAMERGLDGWLENLGQAYLSGIVLDYDGTVCATSERFGLPSPRIQSRIRRLMRSGFDVSFASGRGMSLWRDLRQWVPADSWRTIRLGLYNGAVLARLDQEPATPQVCLDLSEMDRRLRSCLFFDRLPYDVKPTQISVSLLGKNCASRATVSTILAELIEQGPGLPLKTVGSGHSIDVIPVEVSKTRVLKELEGRTGGSVLVIGDQGHWTGNDFELLSASQWSLSVDTCSSDMSRCWNLAPDNLRGPEALEFYLRGLRSPGPGYNPLT